MPGWGKVLLLRGWCQWKQCLVKKAASSCCSIHMVRLCQGREMGRVTLAACAAWMVSIKTVFNLEVCVFDMSLCRGCLTCRYN